MFAEKGENLDEAAKLIERALKSSRRTAIFLTALDGCTISS
jgi:hypothetical protein